MIDDRPWDYIIVGGGSAGCVLANRLSAHGAEVLLVEAGRSDRNPLIGIPAGMMALPRSYDWNYVAEPDPSRSGKVETWAAGKVLGGSSSINGMAWVRGNPADYDGWAALGCKGWDYGSMLSYFEKCESFTETASPSRGAHGPINIEFSRLDNPLTDSFIAAAQAAGHPLISDYNGPSQVGVARGQSSTRRGRRCNTARAYLRPVLSRPNLTVLQRCDVVRIVVEGERACGVEFRHRRSRYVARCRREVIVSAGAFGSPKVLLLSGIGAADTLRRHGIRQVADLPGVGENLQDHPTALLQYAVDLPTLNSEISPLRGLSHTVDYAVRGKGALAAGFANALVHDSDAGGPVPDYQLNFLPFGLTLDSLDRDVHSKKMLAEPTVSVMVMALQCHARGSVTLRSSAPTAPPVIAHQTLGDERDLAALENGCRAARAVVGARPFAQHVREELLPGISVEDSTQWAAFLRRYSTRPFHPIGTCRMGDDAAAVVDSELRVRGIDAMRVVDASVMPTLPRGNTNAPTIAIAERAADLILGNTA
ncbi:MAG: 4-pyridoxate dehydrogenase [Mycobacterium sp.]|nr:4-pyridoxate dehydrogenase [Mycobacterium sp.]